jgi:RimJ/RimL family protein N-acetyltransferase
MTIAIERSRDYALLRRIAIDARIYRLTSDDFSPPPDEWQIAEREDCIYLLATDQHETPRFGNPQDVAKEALGFCVFCPVNGVTFDVHVCFLKWAYGMNAFLAFHKMLVWMWANTRAMRITGAVPDYNPVAIRFAVNSGFEVYGRNPLSWMKGGKLYDLVLLGMSRPTA